ncbi:ribonuclease H-like domain-containing protein [Blastocladiella britannica]|nr:ribonuclease H-like domain-containing protein [Blastocladiella britannica]
MPPKSAQPGKTGAPRPPQQQRPASGAPPAAATAPRQQQQQPRATAPPAPAQFAPRRTDLTESELSLFVRRPGYGSLGRPIKVLANHYAIGLSLKQNIMHYHLTMDPAPTKTLAKKVWAKWEIDHAAKLGVVAAFDGVANVFTTTPFPVDAMEFDVVLPALGDPKTARPGKAFKVTTTKANELDISELHEFVNGKITITNNVLTTIQAIDIAFRQEPSKTMIAAGRSFYDSRISPVPLSNGLDLLSGAFISARVGLSGLTLNLDTAYTAFYRPMPLIDYAALVLRMPAANLAKDGVPPQARMALEKAVRMMTVELTHRDGNGLAPRARIAGISRVPADELKFQLDGTPDAEGTPAAPRTVSVVQYFVERYNIRLRCPKLLAINVGSPQRELWVPFEFVRVAPHQKYVGRLSEDQTSEVIKIAAKKPFERKTQIEKMRSGFNVNNAYTEAFGLSVAPQLMSIQGRILPPPSLGVDRGSVVPRDGSWNFANRRVLRGVKVTAIGVLVLANRRFFAEDKIRGHMDAFAHTSELMGLSFDARCMNDFPVQYASESPQQIGRALPALATAVQQQFGKPADFLVVILGRKSVDTYAEIKRIGDTVIGIPTQCLVSNKVDRANEQYWANVALKVNVKLPQNAFNFHVNGSKFLTPQVPTMIIGADVTHPSPGSDAPSISALVGSVDPFAHRYIATVQEQPASREEMIVHMKIMFATLLQSWFRINKGFPQRIVFYRDGVSEGQFQTVSQIEIRLIQEVLANARATNTKLTFVIVQKRHHTRFFAQDQNDNDRSGNIKAGLVVDRGVTHPTDFDFFLQSQAGLQGTSRPTYYYVLYDQIGWTADDLQLFTFHQTFTYARCTRSVSIVPSAYYAHLACFRARHHAQSAGIGFPVPKLANSLIPSMYFM